MKTRFSKCLPVLTVVLLFSTITFAKVSLDNIGSHKFVSFKITSQHLKEPLAITGSSSGPIFYQIGQDTLHLTGKPFWTEEIKGGFAGKWKDYQGRVIEVSIKPDGNNYNIKFTAEPDTNILKWGFSVDAATDEYFIGLTEKVIDVTQYLGTEHNLWVEDIDTALNLRGETMKMFMSNSMALYCPFYYSSRGYGLFTKGTWPGFYDFCKSDEDIVKIWFEGPSLEMTLYTGSKPADIITAHSLNVGPTIIPPKWTFSCWKWRNNHYNKEAYYDGTPADVPYCSQVVEDVLMMEAFDIPMSIYWLDRPWATGRMGYDDFEWNPKRFPNAVKMISWLKEKNIKTVLWIAPWVSGDMTKEAIEKGYYAKGQLKRMAKYPNIDFTNPEAKKWWQQKGIKKVLDEGIVGFKLDRADETYPASRDTFVYDGRSTRETRNDYPRQYIQATYEISKEVLGDDFVCMPRAAYTGSSRYGVFWGGDIRAGERGLRTAIIAAQRSAVIGFPLWGSDTCGYKGQFERENCARWLAFSCFTPIFEVGPIQDRGFWDMPEEPHYDAELIAIYRLYSKLRMKLVDYSYELAKVANQTGMPPIRPLFMVYPDQKKAWSNWQMYHYGPDLLVCPVYKNGTTEYAVSLPAGQRWIDAWNLDKVYEGGQEVTVKTPMHQIPVFIREGAEIAKAFEGLDELYAESLAIARKKPDLGKLQKAVK